MLDRNSQMNSCQLFFCDSTLPQEAWSCPPLWSAWHWRVINWHGLITHAEGWLATDNHVIAPDFFDWLFTIHQLEITVNADLYLAQSLNLAPLRNTVRNQISPQQNQRKIVVLVNLTVAQISLTVYEVNRTSFLPGFILCLTSFLKLSPSHMCMCVWTSADPPEDENYITRAVVERGRPKYTLGLINLVLSTLDTASSLLMFLYCKTIDA